MSYLQYLLLSTVNFLVPALLIWLASLVVWRLWIHPLRKYPGDTLAALTRWYCEYYDFYKEGQWVAQLHRLHDKYGPIVRVGPNELSFSNPKVYGDIYSIGSKFTKDPAFYRSFNQDTSSFGQVDYYLAKKRRRVLEPLFSRRAILKLERTIQEKIDLFLHQLLAQKSSPANMTLAIRSLTLDIISSYCFDRSIGATEYPSFRHPTVLTIQSTVGIAYLFKAFPILHHIWLRIPQRLLLKLKPRIEGLVSFRNILSQQIDDLLKNPSLLENTDREIVYHHLMTPQPVKGQTEIPSRRSLVDEAVNLMLAGSDTVGNASTLGIFYVLNDRKVVQRLRAELKEAWPDRDQNIGYEALQKLPYLVRPVLDVFNQSSLSQQTAVIKESLRMSYGVVKPLPRVVPPPSATIGGATIPAGTTVSIGATFLHDNPDIFPDPKTFNPDRWLQSDSRELENYLVPFSRGPRSCIGMNLAWAELYLIMGNLFRKLDMVIHDTSIEDFQWKGYFLPRFTGKQFHVIIR